MTVKELIELLLLEPLNAKVVVSYDGGCASGRVRSVHTSKDEDHYGAWDMGDVIISI